MHFVLHEYCSLVVFLTSKYIARVGLLDTLLCGISNMNLLQMISLCCLGNLTKRMNRPSASVASSYHSHGFKRLKLTCSSRNIAHSNSLTDSCLCKNAILCDHIQSAVSAHGSITIHILPFIQHSSTPTHCPSAP